jgi:[acyl-carrier-protein] S-malonyltransferase
VGVFRPIYAVPARRPPARASVASRRGAKRSTKRETLDETPGASRDGRHSRARRSIARARSVASARATRRKKRERANAREREVGGDARAREMVRFGHRDMTASGRYPPQPKFQPFAFYSAVRLGDLEQLKLIASTDPYFLTQDNGAGAPIHFAVTYKQLDMIHWLIREVPECVNLRDSKGFTPLHRAAYLAQFDGYLEIFEYLLSEGADPAIECEDYDPYLNPGRKTPARLVDKDVEVRERIEELIEKYAHVEKRAEPHPALSDWWALYDYGLDEVRTWAKDFKKTFPEDRRRDKARAAKAQFKERRRVKRAEIEAEIEAEIAERREKGAPDFTKNLGMTEMMPGATDSATAPQPARFAFLFPGQGSQAIGMLADDKLLELPAVAKMCEVAREVLGYDLREICVNGPKEKLDDTVYAQPALLLANLAALEKLKDQDPDVVNACDACAGLSLGEYAALVFAGVLSYEDAFKVVKARAEAMAAAAREGSHGMLSVVGLDDDALKTIVEESKNEVIASSPDCVLEITNFLFPQGRVLSGDKVALDVAQRRAQAAGAIKVAFLAVSGAFHTKRMESAKEALEKALSEVTFNAPRANVAIYSNVTGLPMTAKDADGVRASLATQLVSPVMWEQTLKNLIGDGKTKFFELGPNSQIKSMTKRVSLDVWREMKGVQA